MRCSECGYDPDDKEGLRKLLEKQGYDGRFLHMDFGPDKEGSQWLCPVCGNIVTREEPEDYLFTVFETGDLSEGNSPVAWAEMPPYLQPRGEPELCSECDKLLQPSDDKIWSTINGEQQVFCSDDCSESFST